MRGSISPSRFGLSDRHVDVRGCLLGCALFGMEHFGSIIGVVFTAYGFISGIIGPWLSGHLLDVTGGNFEAIFGYLGSLYLLASIMILLTRPQTECIIEER